MKARILLSAVLAVLSWTPPSLAAVRAGVTSYRVQLVLYPGDDGAAVAKRLAAMYRGTVPRLNLFERELNELLPPPDLNGGL
jgi:hypothetical protein